MRITRPLRRSAPSQASPPPKAIDSAAAKRSTTSSTTTTASSQSHTQQSPPHNNNNYLPYHPTGCVVTVTTHTSENHSQPENFTILPNPTPANPTVTIPAPTKRERLAKLRALGSPSNKPSPRKSKSAKHLLCSTEEETTTPKASSSSGGTSSTPTNGGKRRLYSSMKKVLHGGGVKRKSASPRQKAPLSPPRPVDVVKEEANTEVRGLKFLEEEDGEPSSPRANNRAGFSHEVLTNLAKKEGMKPPKHSVNIASSPQRQTDAAWPKKQYSNQMKEWHQREMLNLEMERAGQKRQLKEKDGFCRRVDSYDGQVISVDDKPTYELGNYLGGGVAGVVYEGIRLRPIEEYPVRLGLTEHETTPSKSPSLIMNNSIMAHGDYAVEVPSASRQAMSPVVDGIDTPSRGGYAKTCMGMEETVAVKILNPVGFRLNTPVPLSSAVIVKRGEPLRPEIKSGHVPMEEKHVWWIVNPHSRNLRALLRRPSTNKAMNAGFSQVYSEKSMMTPERSVTSGSVQEVDRGTPDRGLRLSLVASVLDEGAGVLRELSLTKCIEIWGHAPFGATEAEFENMMDTIEQINAGQSPSPVHAPSNPSQYTQYSPSNASQFENANISVTSQSSDLFSNLSGSVYPTTPVRVHTGLSRAAASGKRSVAHCQPLSAFITIPAVPPKFLRWLRQRRAVTKEIRNMMRIGRHRNVVHLYEVLELIQDSKSTMFLVLELVRGGELFDLISSNPSSPSKISKKLAGKNYEVEELMRKFFMELSLGISYCHSNGIAHRDLKPENLLVHDPDGEEATLKIADFGLSAAFHVNDDLKFLDNARRTVPTPPAYITPMSTMESQSPYLQNSRSFGDFENSPGPVTGLSPLFSKMTSISQTALSYLSCGTDLNMTYCGTMRPAILDESPAKPLRRMTSVVGSPHYVAPEIISQTDNSYEGNSSTNSVGYDGTKADVWSSGVILYAMLFRSLPFGEDLLKCPRYQSFQKWYRDARDLEGRRSGAVASLTDDFDDPDIEDMLGPHWFFPSDTSMESRDIILAMLNPEPADRLCVKQVLAHPWLVKGMDSMHWKKGGID